MQWSMYQAAPLADRSYHLHWSLIEIRTRAPNGTVLREQLPRNQSILGSSRAFKSYLSCRKEGREQRFTSLQWNRFPWEAKSLQGMWHFKPSWAQGGWVFLFVCFYYYYYCFLPVTTQINTHPSWTQKAEPVSALPEEYELYCSLPPVQATQSQENQSHQTRDAPTYIIRGGGNFAQS